MSRMTQARRCAIGVPDSPPARDPPMTLPDPRRLAPHPTPARRRWGAAIACLLLLTGCAATTPVATAPEAPTPAASAARPTTRAVPVDRALAAATFDAAWSRVHETHFDPTFNGVDWIALREELAPSAEDAPDMDALRAVIGEMLGRLGQSHFNLIPSESFAHAAWDDPEGDAADEAGVATEPAAPRRPRRSGAGGPGWLGLEARFHAGDAIVVQVDPEGPAAKAGVRAGMTIEAVDGRSPRRILRLLEAAPDDAMLRYEANAMLNAALSAARGEAVELRLRAPREESTQIEVVAARFPGQMSGFGNLPPQPTRLVQRALLAEDLSQLGLDPCGGDEIGVIAFSIWLIPIAAQFDAAIDRFRESLGIVIDLRGNPGGIGGMAMGVGGHFFDTPTSLGTMTTRDAAMHFRVNPRRVDAAGQAVDPLDLPVAILVDEMSASTSEIFAGGMQEAGRARVFGRTTPGAALPATMTTLPNGDILMAAIADFTTPAGVRLEGRGVVPDEAVALDPVALARGIDPDLRAACAWILQQWLHPDEAAEVATPADA